MANLDQQISAAQSQIAAILEALERETGSVVDGIAVHDVEATTLDDDRRQFKRAVHIDLKRLPGTNWSK